MNRNPQPPDNGTRPTERSSRKHMAWTLLLLIPAAVIFTAADRAKESTTCKALAIEVDQMDGMYFVDAPTLHALITERFNLLDQPMTTLPLAGVHEAVIAQPGVASCNLEPTLGGTLKVEVRQQRPLARIWLPDTVVYLDDENRTMPLSTRYTADVPVVHAPDLASARRAIPLLHTMEAHPFWNSFIDQIEVDDKEELYFRPRIGDLVVELGPANDVGAHLDKRLAKLQAFYTELIQRGDLRQYRRISLQYEGQLVASK